MKKNRRGQRRERRILHWGIRDRVVVTAPVTSTANPYNVNEDMKLKLEGEEERGGFNF